MRTRLQPGIVFGGVGGAACARESTQVESALLRKSSNSGLHRGWSPNYESPEEFDLQPPDASTETFRP